MAYSSPDFGDWMNPMLVKELRQSLRSRSFVFAFIWIQASMVLILSFQALSSNETSMGSTIIDRGFSGFLFWANLTLIIHFFIPFRGVFGKDEDQDANNATLLKLTGLLTDMFAVVKWKSSMCLVLLAASSILPYLLLRYYLGQQEIVQDVITFIWLVSTSSVLCAVAEMVRTLGPTGRIVMCTLLVFFGLPIFEGLTWWAISSTLGKSHEAVAALIVWGMCGFIASIVSLTLASNYYQDIARRVEYRQL